MRLTIAALNICGFDIAIINMTDYNSQGSYRTARGLSDLGEEYRALLGGAISEGNMSQGTEKNANKNLRWTRVMTVE